MPLEMLNNKELQRLLAGLRAAIAVPFIDDIEDYIWEAIFSYAKNIPLVDPIVHTRTKRLFDVVDSKRKIGWSCKALQRSIVPNVEFGVCYSKG